jgi:hypothetical protein
MESGADVSGLAIWISGAARSGKTSRLVGEFADGIENYTPSSSILVLAANDETKRKLGDRLAVALEGSYPVVCKTPLGLMGDEVILFWPLIFEQLQLKAQFPLKLRPEMEQELATQFAHAQGFLEYKPQGVSEYRFIRQTLDLLQLAALGGYTPEEIPDCLENGLNLGEQRLFSTNMAALGVFLVQWQQWCLERGLLSYGILSVLYSRYLLPQAKYQEQLAQRAAEQQLATEQSFANKLFHGVRDFVSGVADGAQLASQITGIPASYITAQAALESGWGKRQITNLDGSTSHNLFGIKAGGSWQGKVAKVWTTEFINGSYQKVLADFRSYDSYADSFKDYAALLVNSPRYHGVIANGKNPAGFAEGLQNAGYATDPNYASKLKNIIQNLQVS